jgi:hypothetical protein
VLRGTCGPKKKEESRSWKNCFIRSFNNLLFSQGDEIKKDEMADYYLDWE